MTNFDIITIVVLLIFTTISFFKGGIGSILSLAKWYGAGVLSVMFYPEAKQVTEEALGSSIISSGVAIFGLYIVALIVLWLITKVILLALSAVVGGVTDRFAGLIIGFTIGLIIISSAHYTIRATNNNNDPDWLQEGKTFELTKFGADNLGKVFSGDFSKMIDDFGFKTSEKIKNEISKDELSEAKNVTDGLSDPAEKDLNIEKVRKALEELKAEGLSKEKAKEALQKMINDEPNKFRSFDEEIKVDYEPLPE
ncbi:MAG TPA: hypothetical protein DIV86_00300 [Alphaproteobacteria bacterium]|nr:hypothetical protein [Alphaproteobacteria bacterium]